MMTVWRELLTAAERGEWVALATVIGVDGSAPRASGARMVVWPDGRISGTVGGGNFERQVIESSLAALRTGVPVRFAVHLTRDLGMCCGGAMEVYIEPQRPADKLVIYGAGHVARPAASFAREAGWAVTIVDDREDWNRVERFPGCALLLVDPRKHARELSCDPTTWIFVTTHDHRLDQDLLEALIARPWAWFGLIGSRSKVAKFFLRLRAAGVDPTLFSRVSAPVGLDIGAETPEEIAVSVLAEMVRHRRGGRGPVDSLSAGRPVVGSARRPQA